MNKGKISELIIAKDQKESLLSDQKDIVTSREDSNVILKIKIKNKVFTETIYPNDNIDSASLRVSNKYEIPFILIKNEISHKRNEIKSNLEHSSHNMSINDNKSKYMKGVSFEVSSIEKKNLSSNRTDMITFPKKNKTNKCNISHNPKNNTYSSLNQSPKKNLSLYQTNCSSISTGQRLYNLGKSMIEEKDKEISQYKQESSKKVKEECTFTPKISHKSILLSIKKNYNSANRVPHCFKNFEKPSSKTVEIDLTKDKKKNEEPTQKELELITKLYREREKFEKNKETLREEEFSKNYTFKPTINDKAEPDAKNFFNRLQSWTEKKKSKDNSLLQNSMLDSKSNQTFFSPIISRRSIELGNKKEIWLDLYNEHKTLAMKKEENVKKNVEDYNSFNNKKLVSENSQKISEELFNEMIKRMFECLDSDQDKYITEEDFRNGHFNENELKLMNPIVEKVKLEKKINFESFVKSIHEFISCYKNKKVVKDWFMNNRNKHSSKCTHNKKNEEQFPFHPVVSDSSNEVLLKSTRHSKGFMVRNDMFFKRRLTFQLEQSEKVEEIDKECTFRPSLVKGLQTISEFKKMNTNIDAFKRKTLI